MKKLIKKLFVLSFAILTILFCSNLTSHAYKYLLNISLIGNQKEKLSIIHKMFGDKNNLGHSPDNNYLVGVRGIVSYKKESNDINCDLIFYKFKNPKTDDSNIVGSDIAFLIVDFSEKNNPNDMLTNYINKAQSTSPNTKLVFVGINLHKLPKNDQQETLNKLNAASVLYNNIFKFILISSDEQIDNLKNKFFEASDSLIDKNLYLINDELSKTTKINPSNLFNAIEKDDLNLVKSITSTKTNFPDKDKLYALQTAIKKKKTAIAKHLTDCYPSIINKRNKDGTSALHLAVISEQKELVEYLINKEANLDITDKYGRTPLIYAVNLRNEELAKLLINNGADLDLQDNLKYTALIYTIVSRQTKLSKYLIKNAADLDIQDNYGRTALHFAIAQNNLSLVKDLVNAEADTGIQDNNFNAPLTYAIHIKNFKIANYLIDKTKDLSTQNGVGYAALAKAIIRNNPNIVKHLIDKGVNPNKVKFNQSTPLHFAIESKRLKAAISLLDKTDNVNIINIFGNTPLHSAVKIGNSDIIKHLINKSANLNIKNNHGDTVLQLAIKTHSLDLDTIKYLIDKTKNINVLDDNNNTLLHLAIKEKQAEIAAYLTNKGIPLDSKNYAGQTPLMCAIINDQTELAEYLINQGADIYKEDNQGKTALDYATAKNQSDLMAKIIYHYSKDLDSEYQPKKFKKK